MESASVLQQFRNRLCTLSCPELITNTIFVGSTVNSQQSTVIYACKFFIIFTDRKITGTQNDSVLLDVRLRVSHLRSPKSHLTPIM